MSRKCSRFLFLFLLLSVRTGSLQAAFEDRPLSVRQLSMGYAPTFRSPDPLLLFSNPAVISGFVHWSVASFYSRPFGLKELNLGACGAAVRWRNLGLAAAVSHFGFQLYQEQKFVLVAAMRLFPGLHFGLSLRFQQVQIKNYGRASGFTFDLGWQYQLSPRFLLAGTVQNPQRATIGENQQPLPQIIHMGIQIQPATPVTAVAEIYKDLSFEPEFRFGVEAYLVAPLAIRAGFTRQPGRFTGGFALNLLGIQMEYGFSHHPILGYTHAIEVILAK